jgi:glycosyltransferase involved in cell wall biosynthesis
VGSVIKVYSQKFEVFNFITTHKEGNTLSKGFTFALSLFKNFFTLITNQKIKIIHIHGASYGSFYRKFIIFLIGKYLFKKKIIYHIHGAEFHLLYKRSNKLAQKMISFFINNCNCVICLSQKWREFLNKNFIPKRIEILPNIIDYPIEVAENKKTNLIFFLFLGYIGKRKGIFDLLNVLIENKVEYEKRIKLLIGGNGEIQYLRDVIKKNNIEHFVEFGGWIKNEKKIEVFNKSDIFILPSYNEGLPISILEAMSYGEAIISTTVGGIPEIVRDQENGLLIEPGNLEQLKAAIDFFLDNHEKINQYGNNSKKMVENHFPDAVMNQLSCIYQSLLT